MSQKLGDLISPAKGPLRTLTPQQDPSTGSKFYTDIDVSDLEAAEVWERSIVTGVAGDDNPGNKNYPASKPGTLDLHTTGGRPAGLTTSHGAQGDNTFFDELQRIHAGGSDDISRFEMLSSPEPDAESQQDQKFAELHRTNPLASDCDVDGSGVPARVSRVMASNRFTPDRTSVASMESGRLYTVDGKTSTSKKLGTSKFVLGSGDASVGDLTNVARRMIVAAMGAPHADDLTSVDQWSSVIGHGGLYTPTQAVGKKVDAQSMRPTVAVGSAVARSLDFVDSRSSFGQLNGPDAKFDRSFSTSMTTLVASYIASSLIIAESLGALMKNSRETSTSTRSTDFSSSDPTLMPLGSSGETKRQMTLGGLLSRSTVSVASPIDDAMSKYVPSLRHDFMDCVRRGIRVFFAVPIDRNDLGVDASLSVQSTTVNIAQSAGFYIAVMRSIIRDSERIATTTEGDFSENLSSDRGAGVTTGIIEAGLDLIRTISTTSTFRFVVTMAVIGDISLTSDSQFESRVVLDDKQRRTFGRDGDSRKQQLSTERSPMALLLPDIIAELKRGPQFTKKIGDLPGTVRSSENRLSDDNVRSIEEKLQGEYMPFFFHDLRTNEIVSFHAFLSNLTDAFTPEYTSSTGIGRIDEVKTYKKTARKINITFYVAAMDRHDFDVMWYKINKLVTLVYPQWSGGRSVKIRKDDREIDARMPFSHVVTSTPLVRLRIGDVVRSNFSRFAMLRLFGEDKLAKSQHENIEKSPVSPATSLQVGSRVVSVQNAPVRDTLSNPKVISGPFRGRVSAIDNQTSTATVESSQKSYTFNISDLTVVPDVPKGLENVDSSVVTTAQVMQSNTNMIEETGLARSFKSATVGSGLAGVIEGLDFDYSEGTYEIDPGSRAPKLVKVTLSFAPVHDIAPGIDDQGFNRAPLYRVGSIMSNICDD